MSAENQPVIVWFRQDLRLADNPALFKASAQGQIIPLFIYDEVIQSLTPPESAAYWWLYKSLAKLNQSLSGQLLVKSGPAAQVLLGLIRAFNVKAVWWNRIYDPAGLARDKALKSVLRESGTVVHSCNASLLREPWTTQKDDETPL